MSCTEITKQFANSFLFALYCHNTNLTSPTYANAVRAYAAMILKYVNKALDLSKLFSHS